MRDRIDFSGRPSVSPTMAGRTVMQRAMLPTLGVGSLLPDGDALYDPAAEHSVSGTRRSVEEALTRARVTRTTAPSAPPAPGTPWQLASLGLPPVDFAFYEQEGIVGGGARLPMPLEDEEDEAMGYGGIG